MRAYLESLDKRIVALTDALTETVAKIDATVNITTPAAVHETLSQVANVRTELSESMSDLMALVYNTSAEHCTRLRDELGIPALSGVHVHKSPTSTAAVEDMESPPQPVFMSTPYALAGNYFRALLALKGETVLESAQPETQSSASAQSIQTWGCRNWIEGGNNEPDA